MGKPLHALLVEDSEDDALLTIRQLARGGFDVEYRRVDTPQALIEALPTLKWDIVIADFSMPHFSGTAALKLMRDSGTNVPFIFVSGTIGEDVAVKAMRDGASDYIMKGNLARLVPAVERELRETEARSERRSLEEQLRQSQKMEAIGRLAGGIAHDFNNLLGVIGGYSELVLDRTDLDATARSHVQEIQKAGQRAATLTRQLLAFSRKQVLEPRVIDLNALVTEMGGMFRRVIGEDVELVLTASPDLGCVRVDPSQMEQVLMNLVVNARDAMPQGGKLVIETANVYLDETYLGMRLETKPGDYVRLSVSDSGVGMDSETMARVFEPFFTTKELGTGLGLATVYGIVKQSDGNVWLYSEVGKGTTFKVYLPRVAEDAKGTAAAAASVVPKGTETILLVEDAAALRDVTFTFLADAGYRVLTAENGASACEIASRLEDPLHLLVTDVVMPMMSGPELAKVLAATHPGTKVLYISGYVDEALARHGVLHKGAVLLSKPYTRDALLRKIRAVLDS